MKIKRNIGGVEVEIELTHDEVAEAYLEHEHFYDCESVRGDLNSGCYEEFEGLSDEEWENAVHEIAWEARRQMEKYGLDEWDARDAARKKYVEGHNLGTVLEDAYERSKVAQGERISSRIIRRPKSRSEAAVGRMHGPAGPEDEGERIK